MYLVSFLIAFSFEYIGILTLGTILLCFKILSSTIQLNIELSMLKEFNSVVAFAGAP